MENYKITIPHFYCIKYEDFVEHKTMLLEVDLRDLSCCFSNKKIKKLLDEKHGNSKKL